MLCQLLLQLCHFSMYGTTLYCIPLTVYCSRCNVLQYAVPNRAVLTLPAHAVPAAAAVLPLQPTIVLIVMDWPAYQTKVLYSLCLLMLVQLLLQFCHFDLLRPQL
jgi:hypothetical protein